jgi:hypothetical protein
MTAKWIHAKTESVAFDGICDSDDLLRSPMFKTALDEEVSKPIHHEGVRLLDNGLNDVKLLLRSPDFQFLL